MITHRLNRNTKISQKASYDLIMTMAKRSNHHLEVLRKVSLKTDADVAEFIRSFTGGSETLEGMVNHCRDYSQHVPIFENFIGSRLVMGGREIVTSAYRLLYEKASENLTRAIESVSFGDVQVAITSGISSIDAYISHRAEKWNAAHPNDLLIDSRDHKVSFDDKIDSWIPKMTGGPKFDKSRQNWTHFKILRGIRDDVMIHAKDPSYARSAHEIAEAINMFRTGIAGLLIQLHDLIDEKIPSMIIYDSFAPDVEVVETGL
jgi:hypothetical protein